MQEWDQQEIVKAGWKRDVSIWMEPEKLEDEEQLIHTHSYLLSQRLE